MNKLSKRLLSWLLLAAMLCTLLPTAVFAEDADVLEPAEDTAEYDAVTGEQLSPDTDEPETYALDEGLEAQTVADSGEFYRIVHLDCGRKYFTKDWIIALINEMAEDGYNQLQLAFGNDGLRFLLDDMSITVGDTTYESAIVTAGIQEGNKAYNASKGYTTETNELTEAEMDEIIAHAQTKGIEIVPMLNMPGHMDAVLDAIEYVGISDAHAVGDKTSTRSLKLQNTDAIAFAQAFLEKYVAYFAEKGCKFFHIGADEYCNNGEYSGMGFAAMGSQLYDVFAQFVNNAAATVKEHGMTPRAWNDGINYGSYSSNFDSEIQVTYWSSGWSGYNVASASTLSGKGHQMINTHGDYYYILGKSDKFDSDYSYAGNFSNTAFAGGTISNPVGSMFCIWCDEPGAETEQQVAQKARLPLRAMALRMQDQGITGMSTDVVSGGFNADGFLNTDSVGGDNGESGDTTTPEINYGSELTGGNTLAAGATTTLSLGNGKTATWVSSDTGVITLTSAEKVSTMAASEGITATSVTAQAVGAGTATVTATPEGGTAVTLAITVPQAADNNGTATGDPVTVYVGETKSFDIEGVNYSEATGNDESIAKVSVEPKSETQTTLELGSKVSMTEANTEYTGVIYCNGTYMTLNGTTVGYTDKLAEATEFTVSYKTLYDYIKKYTIKSGDYYIGYQSDYGNYKVVCSSSPVEWQYSEGFCYYYYLTFSGTSWTLQRNAQNKTYLYNRVESTEATNKTVVTVTGVEEGNTSVTVGNKTYPIVVKRYEKTVNMVVNTTSSAYTQKYVGNGNVTYSQEGIVTATVNKDAKNVTFKALKVGTTTVIVGDTKYTVTVTKEDLTQVTPLTVEYWITNTKLKDTNDQHTMNITASQANGESGVVLADELPKTLKNNDRDVEYWQVRLLDTLNNEQQTNGNGIDKTTSGSAITKVRYYQSTWQGLCGEEWISINTAHQIVAYYMEILDISNDNGTSELHVNAADWGIKGDGVSGSADYISNTSNGYNTVSIQLVYEDGSFNPKNYTAEDLKAKTFVYGNWSADRGIGTIKLDGGEDFEIYKVTADKGMSQGSLRYNSGNYYGPATIESFTWNDKAETVWEGDPTQSVTIYNNAQNPSKEGFYNKLTWTKAQEAILIRVYVKAKPKADSLTVHYVDNNTTKEFYNYHIPVKQGTTFSEEFGIDADGNVKNGTGNVINIYNNTITVSSDLKTMPQIDAQYRYTKYKCVNAECDPDGKNVTLYYEFENVVDFVADFGLPIEIEPEKLNSGLLSIAEDKISVQGKPTYGTAEVNDGKIVYTPSSVLTGSDTFTVNATVTTDGKEEPVGYIVNIYPANNVLYEETFATVDENSGWNTVDKANTNTQKVSGTDDVYGYDKAYAKNNDKYSNGSAYVATLTANGESPHAQFTFKGTGLEIMGECGANTGTLVIGVTNASDKGTRVYIVDTHFNGQLTNGDKTETIEGGMTYQIPVVHDLSLLSGEHTVDIYGSYPLSSSASKAQNAQVAVQLASDGTETVSELDAFLAEIGYEGAEVEYISMNEVLGGYDEGVAVYANQVADADSTTTTATGPVVYFDGFRVYNTLDTEPSAYVESEAKFTSLYDVASNSYWNDTDKNGQGLVYVENAGEKETTHGAYKNSGPQNEIYIGANQAIAFKVTEGVTNVQVSAKAIKGTPTLNSNDKQITTQTEMYYDVTADVQDGLVVIMNNRNDTILSLVDLKIIGGTVDTQSTITAAQVEAAIYNLQNPKPAEPDDSGSTGDGNTGDAETPSKPEGGNTGNGETPSKPEGGNTGNGETTSKPEGGNTGNGETPNKPDSGNTGDADKPEDPEESWQNPFKDVDMKAWYAPAIRYLSSRGIVNGLPGGIFGTENDTTRSMVITMLYRLAKSPKAKGEIPFDDVPEEAWYADAALWAYQTGIVKGYAEGNNLLFKPDQAITRQEFVTMLYRYVTDYKKMDISIRSDLDTYTDKDQVQPWALDAMKWAVDNGIMNGYNEGKNWFLKPTNKTKRSEMAKLFYGLYGYLGQN